MEVAQHGLAFEAAERVAHRDRELLAVARILHGDVLLDAHRDPLRVGIPGEDVVALLVDRRVVERVHQHLVDALLDRRRGSCATRRSARRTSRSATCTAPSPGSRRPPACGSPRPPASSCSRARRCHRRGCGSPWPTARAQSRSSATIMLATRSEDCIRSTTAARFERGNTAITGQSPAKPPHDRVAARASAPWSGSHTARRRSSPDAERVERLMRRRPCPPRPATPSRVAPPNAWSGETAMIRRAEHRRDVAPLR